MDSKKISVAIVGAGISGLTSAIYLQRSGFDVTIYEQHNVAGGLSSNWVRKGYLFESGMHWLTGSSEKMPLNRVWREVGALKENNPIFVKDPFYTLISKNDDGSKRELHLYRDIDRLEKHFLEYSPEDERAIKNLCRDVRAFLNVHVVIDDIPFLKAEHPTHPSLGELLGMLQMVPTFLKINNKKYADYVAEFKNPDIRKLLMSVVGDRYNATSFVYTLASYASGDCGFPEGGSKVMAQNMVETFLSLGGKIEYLSHVDKVVTEQIRGKKKAVGVMVKGELKKSDVVIVTQDALRATDDLFEGGLNEPWVKKMKQTMKGEQNIFVCLGVKCDLSYLPRAFILPLEKPFVAAGLESDYLRVCNYALYPNHAPAGCTTLTCLFLGDTYGYWKAAKADGSYKQKKEMLAQSFIDTLSEFVPEIKGNVEVTDVATPLTYERYCSSYEGSWMTVWRPGDMRFVLPHKSKSISGLYFAGHRMEMPGGLPVAANSGRRAAQYVCRDNNVVFK